MVKKMLKYLIGGFSIIVNHKQVLNLISFALCLFIICVLNIFARDTLISEQENRVLQQIPEFRVDRLFSGDYFKDFENYFADQFCARESFVAVSSMVKEVKGFPGMQDVQIVTAGGFNALEGHAAVNPDDMQAEAASRSSIPSITGDSGYPITAAGSASVRSGQDFSASTADGLNNPGGTTHHTVTKQGTDGHISQSGDVSGESGVEGVGYETGQGAAELPDGTSNPATMNSEKSSHTAANPDSASPLAEGEYTDAQDKDNEDRTHSSLTETGPAPTKEPDRDDNGKTINRILIYKNGAYALFPFSEDSGNYYVSTLNQFSEKVGEDVTVYSLLAPTSMEFIEQEKYRVLSDSQKETIDYVNARLKKVVPVDAYTPLQSHKDEYIFFRTDHHWTALGAYYGYTGFARAAGLEPVAINEYETETIHDYVGSMYETTGSSNLKRNPDTITVYKPFVKNEYHVYYGGPIKMNVIDMSHADKKIKYRVFLSGDRPLGIIQTENTNGKRILVIKDSYGNAMVPFLLPHYQEIYVIDPRQYEKNIYTLVQENQIQEVLFLNYVPILSYYGYVDQLVKIMEAEG